jgi:hypothetical protein
MQLLYENGMATVQAATVERLKVGLNDVLQKDPRNTDALTQLGLLEFGFATQPLALRPNADPRTCLVSKGELDHAHLVRAVDTLERAIRAGVQDRRVFRALGLASWQLCRSGAAIGVDTITVNGKRHDGREALLTAHMQMGRVSAAHSSDGLFMTTFARVCEANNDLERAITVLGDMITEIPHWSHLPHAVLYASNLCFHPVFGGEGMYIKGLQYLEWLAGESPPADVFGWTESELLFIIGRAYQIAGRGDLAAGKFRRALAKRKGLASADMVKDDAIVKWLSDKATWQRMGHLFAEAGLNLFAADALAQAIHMTEEAHTVDDWVHLADVLRRSGAMDPAVRAGAHAYEIDRCHGPTRVRLASWSPQWRKMFAVESRVVTKIQALFRMVLAKSTFVDMKKEFRLKVWNATTIQLWYVYERGHFFRKERRRKVTAMVLRMKNRLRDAVFFAWKKTTQQRAEARNLFRKQVLRLIQRILPKWRQFTIEAIERKRLIRAKQEANAVLVAKSLNKILMRAVSQAFTSWAHFVRRNVRVRAMMRRHLLARKRFIKNRWYLNVRDGIEERHMITEPTVFVRQDDITRRLHHADLLTRPGEMPVRPVLRPFVVGPGDSWRRNTERLTAVHACLFRARKTRDTLSIPVVPVDEKELNEFMSFPSVVSMSAPLTGSDGRTLAEKLIGNKSVRSLLLYNGRLGDKGTMAIGATLATHTGAVLQSLGVGNNSVGPRGAAALGKALREKHCTLTTLYLDKNPAIGDVGAEVLAEALETNVRLGKLVLSGNDIGDHGAVALARALRPNHSLRSLSLDHNRIGLEGMGAFADLIGASRNKTLSILSLAHNPKIGDAGATSVANTLGPKTTHLLELDMGACGVGDPGAVALADAFFAYGSGVTTSKTFNDNSDDDGDDDELDMDNVVREAKDYLQGMKLQRLGLCRNQIHGSSAKQLSDSVRTATEACAVDFEGNPIDATTRGELVFDTFKKRLQSPRRDMSPRRSKPVFNSWGSPVAPQMEMSVPSSLSSLSKNKMLPSRAALESLGRLGLGNMGQQDAAERDEDLDLSHVASFSPQGFTLKRLPPVKPGLRYGQRGRTLL